MILNITLDSLKTPILYKLWYCVGELTNYLWLQLNEDLKIINLK